MLVNGVVVRPADESDVAAVRRLEESWAAEGITRGFVPDEEDRIRELLRGPYFLVAESGGRVVGFASASEHASEGTAVIPAGLAYLEIDNLRVEAGSRSAGVGGLLLERLLETARARGVTKSLVYSASEDVRRVLDFYGAHGYRSWYVRLFRDV